MMGSIPGGDPQGGAAAQGAGQARALHAEALADDHSRDLPQGEERRQTLGLLQGLCGERHGAGIGAPARLRDRGVVTAVHPAERIHDRPQGAFDARPTIWEPTFRKDLERNPANSPSRCPRARKRITDADIEANIGISKDFNNFELCKAVVTRRHGPRADDRRALRPQPQGQPAAR